ncbi:hypothetical protein [Streptomyces odontomachi]|uniref:hypothetical protein n=1 Tax=Streptomyces odontomachi TaxID=2944940 RepID=UPI002109369C|nr:hypothetical protein [Streptomyces sp. ODS25]
MTKSNGRWKRQGFIPASRRTRENPVPEPLYAALMESWRRQGRTLPGRPDPEWNALVSRDHWPRG